MLRCSSRSDEKLCSRALADAFRLSPNENHELWVFVAVHQGPALEALWQQCCSDCALVRSACCDAVVQLVDQGHADLNYVLNSVLNLLPSARYGGSTTRVNSLGSSTQPCGFKTHLQMLRL